MGGRLLSFHIPVRICLTQKKTSIFEMTFLGWFLGTLVHPSFSYTWGSTASSPDLSH